MRAMDRYFFGRELLPEHPELEIIREDSRRIGPAHLEGIDHVIDLVAISNDPSGDAFERTSATASPITFSPSSCSSSGVL